MALLVLGCLNAAAHTANTHSKPNTRSINGERKLESREFEIVSNNPIEVIESQPTIFMIMINRRSIVYNHTST